MYSDRMKYSLTDLNTRTTKEKCAFKRSTVLNSGVFYVHVNNIILPVPDLKKLQLRDSQFAGA